jgi:hypothetical protein
MKNMECYGFERKTGKTPSGGRYSETYYYKNLNEACAKEDATHCVIYEMKRNGKVLNIIHCML